jgi:hypothetical protein
MKLIKIESSGCHRVATDACAEAGRNAAPPSRSGWRKSSIRSTQPLCDRSRLVRCRCQPMLARVATGARCGGRAADVGGRVVVRRRGVRGNPSACDTHREGAGPVTWRAMLSPPLADAVATHCVLSNLGAPPRRSFPPEQTREAFVAMQGALAQAGMTMKDVARTWFFLDDILSWYGAFNRVRNTVFEQHELRPGALPASTGVRGRNPAGAALTVAVWAVKPHDETNAVDVRAVPAAMRGNGVRQRVQSRGGNQLGRASRSCSSRARRASNRGS